jgi:hypothetical protein
MQLNVLRRITRQKTARSIEIKKGFIHTELYLTADEEILVVQWQSKHYIKKIMFVACVGRPIKSSLLGELWVVDDRYRDSNVSFHLFGKRGQMGNPNV